MRLRTRLKHGLLRALDRATARHAVLLARQAGGDDLLDLTTSYRVEGRRLESRLHEPAAGRLDVTLAEQPSWGAGRTHWRASARYPGPSTLRLDFASGAATLGGEALPPLPRDFSPPRRRFQLHLALAATGAPPRGRTTGHYFAVDGAPIDERYFFGDAYADHDEEARDDHPRIAGLVGGRGPVLEVGCADGGLLELLDRTGVTSFGVDASEFAVERARSRLGDGRVYRAEPDREPLPAEIVARGPFGAVVLAAVLEHFADPWLVLERLAAVAAPGARLVIETSNADGVGRRFFGRDWEGYYDWTHAGVDVVSASALRERLPGLGWAIESLETHGVWDASSDPTHATVRDWWHGDARFRRLLVERDLGDFLRCIATRR